jgi:putative NADH-flavin reductase
MKVALLGATGSVGRLILQQALERHHRITALVRNPERLAGYGDAVRIVRGDALDREAVENTVAGQDAVIYSIGINTGGRTTLFSDSTRILLGAMERHGVKRLVCITGVGAGETKGHGGLLYDWLIFPLFTRDRYEDKDRQEALIRQSSLDWVIVRPAPYREGSARGNLEILTSVRDAKLRRISRTEVATFVLDQLSDDRYLRQTPFIGHR